MVFDEWLGTLPPEDQEAYRKRGMARMGFGARPAILTIDMIYQLLDDRYPTAYGQTGMEVVHAVARLLAEARPRGVPVFHVRRVRRVSDTEKGVIGLKWPYLKDAGWLDDHADQFPPEIAPQPGELVVDKEKTSGFFETPLRSMLTFLQVDTVIVTGLSTSGCVRATVTDAFSCNFRVIVPVECVSDRSKFAHRANLFDLQMKFADVVSLEETIAYLQRLPAPEGASAAPALGGG